MTRSEVRDRRETAVPGAIEGGGTRAAAAAGRWSRAALVTVIAFGLLAIGGAGAVALRLGQPSTPSVSSVDAGFAWDMSRHHLQAVEMADLAQDRSRDPLIVMMAFNIASTQTNQVGRMQGWLDLWGLSQTDPNAPMAWMGDVPAAGGMAGMAGMSAGSSAGALMPGMASTAELAQLRSLSGSAFDVDFLRLMIRHHQGGLGVLPGQVGAVLR